MKKKNEPQNKSLTAMAKTSGRPVDGVDGPEESISAL